MCNSFMRNSWISLLLSLPMLLNALQPGEKAPSPDSTPAQPGLKLNRVYKFSSPGQPPSHFQFTNSQVAACQKSLAAGKRYLFARFLSLKPNAPKAKWFGENVDKLHLKLVGTATPTPDLLHNNALFQKNDSSLGRIQSDLLYYVYDEDDDEFVCIGNSAMLAKASPAQAELLTYIGANIEPDEIGCAGWQYAYANILFERQRDQAAERWLKLAAATKSAKKTSEYAEMALIPVLDRLGKLNDAYTLCEEMAYRDEYHDFNTHCNALLWLATYRMRGIPGVCAQDRKEALGLFKIVANTPSPIDRPLREAALYHALILEQVDTRLAKIILDRDQQVAHTDMLEAMRKRKRDEAPAL